jgi:hypothetical protein
MAEEDKKQSHKHVLRRLIIGAFTPAVAASLVSSANEAEAAVARKLAVEGKNQPAVHHDQNVDDLAMPDKDDPEALINWWPYFQYQQVYNQSIYIQCYVQYPQCGPASW